ncbi:hypothetical protein P885DRAFT_62733 [Corynascus similis CBS 632.67]
MYVVRLDVLAAPKVYSEVTPGLDDVIACYHYLNKLGNIMCTTDYRTIMCKAGKAHIRGNALHGSTSSYCRHIANAVLWAVDHCPRPNKSCAGNEMAAGNGDFLVGSMSNEW